MWQRTVILKLIKCILGSLIVIYSVEKIYWCKMGRFFADRRRGLNPTTRETPSAHASLLSSLDLDLNCLTGKIFPSGSGYGQDIACSRNYTLSYFKNNFRV